MKCYACNEEKEMTYPMCPDCRNLRVKLSYDYLVLEKQNKQMREALSLILEGAIHDFHYVCQHRDSCLCWGCQKKRVKAALSAAERGER
jgi:hypothetical protein